MTNFYYQEENIKNNNDTKKNEERRLQILYLYNFMWNFMYFIILCIFFYASYFSLKSLAQNCSKPVKI